MEGSSGSGFHNSDSSRALNSSGVSDRNQRPHCPEGNPFSGEAASHDSGFRKERDWLLLAQGDQHKSLGGFCEDEVEADPLICSVEWGDISLRQWLDKPERSVDLFECLHVFRQIVEIVNVAHSQGVVVNNVRPSCFVMSSFNHISFIESASCSDTGSDSLGEGVNCQGVVEVKTPTSRCPHDVHPQSFGSEDFMPAKISTTALSDSSCMLSSAVYAARASLIEETEENKMKDRRKDEEVEGKKQSFPMKQILLMEMSWYTSPEEAAGTPSSCPSDVYRLGVLLFEVYFMIEIVQFFSSCILIWCFIYFIFLLLLLQWNYDIVLKHPTYISMHSNLIIVHVNSYSAHSAQEKRKVEPCLASDIEFFLHRYF